MDCCFCCFFATNQDLDPPIVCSPPVAHCSCAEIGCPALLHSIRHTAITFDPKDSVHLAGGGQLLTVLAWNTWGCPLYLCHPYNLNHTVAVDRLASNRNSMLKIQSLDFEILTIFWRHIGVMSNDDTDMTVDNDVDWLVLRLIAIGAMVRIYPILSTRHLREKMYAITIITITITVY